MKIVLIEPSEIITEGLCCLLKKIPQVEIVGIFNQSEKAHNFLLKSSVEILIINPLLYDEFKSYSTILIGLSYQYFEPSVWKKFQSIIDINDHYLKIAEKLEIFKKIRHTETIQNENHYELSDREKDILILIAKGLQNKEIAEKSCISIHTVISHRKNIVNKTGIKSVAGLTVYALVNNLIEENEIL